MNGRGDFVVRYVVPGANALCLGYGATRLIGAMVLFARGETRYAILACGLALLAFAIVVCLARLRHRQLTRISEPAASDERVSTWIAATLGHDWSQASPFPPPRRTGRYAAGQRIVMAALYALVWGWLCMSLVVAIQSTFTASASSPAGIALLPVALVGMWFPLMLIACGLILLERVLALIGRGFGEPVNHPSTRYAELRRKHGHG